MLGEDRVTKFVIQEIVNSTMDDYVKNVSHCQHSLVIAIYFFSYGNYFVSQLHARKI